MYLLSFWLILFYLFACVRKYVLVYLEYEELKNNDMKTEKEEAEEEPFCHPSVFEVGAGSQVQSTFAIDLCHAETTGMDQK